MVLPAWRSGIWLGVYIHEVPKHISNGACRFRHRGSHQVSVARGGLNLRMTEKPADHCQAHALADGEGGKTVSQVMDADILYSGHLSEPPPRLLDIIQVAAFF